MSKLAVKPLLSLSPARAMASSMVRPITNTCPIIRIAAPTRLAHERLASAGDEALQDAGFPVIAHQRAGDHQAPGGGIDQRRIAIRPACCAQSAVPILSRISASAVSAIGNAQERFGERQQRHAFGGVQPILLQEAVDPAFALRRAQIGEQCQRAADNGIAGGRRQRGGRAADRPTPPAPERGGVRASGRGRR